MILLSILVGFSLAATLFTVSSVAYCLWRFSWKPWAILRADIVTLNAKLDEQLALYSGRLDALDEFTRASRIQGLSDEEAASRERRFRMRRAQQGLVVP